MSAQESPTQQKAELDSDFFKDPANFQNLTVNRDLSNSNQEKRIKRKRRQGASSQASITISLLQNVKQISKKSSDPSNSNSFEEGASLETSRLIAGTKPLSECPN